MKTPAELKEIEAGLFEALRRRTERRVDFFTPYPKQYDFFKLGPKKRERLLQAGNQLGKTYAGAYEVTCHLTGEYPEWWPGRKWEKPTRWWAAGETSLVVRDVQQKLLCGEPGVEGSLGTGMIPKRNFTDRPSLARGVTDAFDTVQVAHKSGGTSILKFKSYEQGRAKFQGDTIDGLWFDEEPPAEIYSEGLTRTAATKGMVFLTFTPLKGMSDVVSRFHNEPSKDRSFVVMTIFDAKHISPEDRAIIIAGYPNHEREARAMGVPMMGSGRIFPYSDESISEHAIESVPAHWAKIWGIDFGIGHKFGAVLLLWDRDLDVIHVHKTIRVADQLPLQHAAAIRPIGGGVPVAWPQDGTAREKGTGEPLASMYKKQKLRMLPDHATWPDGSVSTEAAITDMADRMTTGRLKVARELSDWFEEFRLYHRKDGIIVRVHDDLLAATQKGLMMKRFAKPVALGNVDFRRSAGGPDAGMARDIDFPLF